LLLLAGDDPRDRRRLDRCEKRAAEDRNRELGALRRDERAAERLERRRGYVSGRGSCPEPSGEPGRVLYPPDDERPVRLIPRWWRVEQRQPRYLRVRRVERRRRLPEAL
jgi:hypothetical protein